MIPFLVMVSLNESLVLFVKSFATFFLIAGVAVLFAVLSQADLSRSQLPGQSTEQILQRAMMLNQQEHYQESIALLLAALKRDPKKEPLRLLLRQTAFLQVNQQIETGSKKLEENPHDVATYHSMADAYVTIDQRLKALEILLQGVTENPQNTSLWMAIGKIELAAERYKEALSVFNQAISIDGNNSEAHYVVAYLLLRDETVSGSLLETALAHARTALSMEPHNADFLQIMAEASYRKGDNQKAIELITEAMRIAPDDSINKTLMARFKTR